MRIFNYNAEYQKLLDPELVRLLTKIHESLGRQKLLAKTKGPALSSLVTLARLQSTEASNRLEDIIIAAERLKKLAGDKTMPKNQSECELAGYRDVQSAIDENYNYLTLQPETIYQLYRDLARYSGKTVPAWSSQIQEETVAACDAVNAALADDELDPLLVIPVFTVDYLCLHPSESDDSRMSRLLMRLMLYRSGCSIGKYISIENRIAETVDSYDEALQKSSDGWPENKNDYRPFVRYMLEVLLDACNEFDERADILVIKKLSKPDRVQQILQDSPGRITKREIIAQCPDISLKTIDRTLTKLMADGGVKKISGGRYTSYLWIKENGCYGNR